MIYVYMTEEDDQKLLEFVNNHRAAIVDQLKLFLINGRADAYDLTIKMLELVAPEANVQFFLSNVSNNPKLIPFHMCNNKYKFNGVSALHKKVVNSLGNAARYPGLGGESALVAYKEGRRIIYGVRENIQQTFFRPQNYIEEHTQLTKTKELVPDLSKMAIINLLNPREEEAFTMNWNFEFRK